MKRRKTLERSLLGATIASGMLVAFAHGGGTTGCASSQRRVDTGTPQFSVRPGQLSTLVLTHAVSSERVTIQRGSVIELTYITKAGTSNTVEGPLVAFSPAPCSVILNEEDDRVELPCSRLRMITLLGENPRPTNMGRGALVGGLTGAAIGGIAGAAVGGESYGPVCAVGFGLPAGGLGAGAGVGIGAVGSPDRGRTEYALETYRWVIETGSPPQTTVAPRQASAADASSTEELP